METSKKKIDILEHIIAAVAGAYYNINLTRNLVPGQDVSRQWMEKNITSMK